MLRPPPPTPGDAPAPLAQLRSMWEGGAAAFSHAGTRRVRALDSPLDAQQVAVAARAQGAEPEGGRAGLEPARADAREPAEEVRAGDGHRRGAADDPAAPAAAEEHRRLPPAAEHRAPAVDEGVDRGEARARPPREGRLARAEARAAAVGARRAREESQGEGRDAAEGGGAAGAAAGDDMDIKTDTPQERRQRRSTVDALPVIATPSSPRDGDVDVKSPNQPSPPNQPPNQPPVKSRAARMEAANLRGEVFDLQGGKALNLRDNQKSPVPPPASQTAAVSVETLADAWQDSIPDGESWAADQRISTAMLEYSRQTRRNSKDLSEGAHALAIERANAAAAKAEAEAKKADAAAAAAAAPRRRRRSGSGGPWPGRAPREGGGGSARQGRGGVEGGAGGCAARRAGAVAEGGAADGTADCDARRRGDEVPRHDQGAPPGGRHRPSDDQRPAGDRRVGAGAERRRAPRRCRRRRLRAAKVGANAERRRSLALLKERVRGGWRWATG